MAAGRSVLLPLHHRLLGRAGLPRRAYTVRAAEPKVIVCGAGVAGIAASHYLAIDQGAAVTVVDPRPPLTFTSCRSTECYRNYWQGHDAMTSFMNRSIDLLEHQARECDNAFILNRRGYCFLTASAEGAARHIAEAEAAGGAARVYDDGSHSVRYDPLLPYDAVVDDFAVFSGGEAVNAFFSSLPPFLGETAVSLKYCGRCGWFNAQQMGARLLEQARAAGVTTRIPATVVGFETSGGAVSGVTVRDGDGRTETLRCDAFVNAAGPYAAHINELLLAAGAGGRPLPLENEIHAKAMLRDVSGAVPQEAPMLIWEDEVRLPWSDDEREALSSLGGFEASLTAPLPAGAHVRPYPGATNTLLMLWEALHADVPVAEPPAAEPELRGSLYAELLLRGLTPLAPGLAGYLAPDGSMVAHVQIDGGYYTKAPDNLPLIGPVPGAPAGAYICAGLSGYGVMAANAAGELLARHVAGARLPEEYAAHFLPERWMDDGYVRGVDSGATDKGLSL